MSFLEHIDDVTELKTGELTVGSGKEASLRLQQMDLAPRHLTLMVGEDGTTLVRPYDEDLLVTVNGKRITEPTRLTAGDLVAAGNARLRYLAVKNERDYPAFDESAYLLTDDKKMAYAVARRTINIGRDASSTIQLKDPDSSRQHADICSEAGLHVLHSLGENGTKVNGKLISSRHILEENDLIDAGEIKLRYTRKPPPQGTRVSTGGESYDLDISSRPTGSQLKLTENPADVLNSPKVLRIVAIVVAVMALLMVVLVIMN